MPCRKVFIVEDDHDIREALETLLVSEDFRVESFSNGETAIARLRVSSPPCLVLLDMLMPVMNGAEFMHYFQTLPAAILPIPVFLVSGTSSPEEAERLGCRGFIKKPVSLESLLVIVRKFCETRGEAHG